MSPRIPGSTVTFYSIRLAHKVVYDNTVSANWSCHYCIKCVHLAWNLFITIEQLSANIFNIYPSVVHANATS